MPDPAWRQPTGQLPKTAHVIITGQPFYGVRANTFAPLESPVLWTSPVVDDISVPANSLNRLNSQPPAPQHTP
ncbi:hypothetical protein E4U09_002513 [Claviceps aff. purpurea]|uniref:Uncharacterized protein n=1 Tax=Claviceps aff. purpurea TaxID=1967640 RepID=A0A9P7U2S5_9HYPO|nr:hypothetical protein E4U09_002513 [Claviceps aff. purpurea]